MALCGFVALVFMTILPGSIRAETPEADLSDRQQALNELALDIISEHPNIPHIASDQARNRVGRATFIDVREAKEFAVSRIPGAVHINDAEALIAFAREHDQPLVLYCSVGQRSAEFTRVLHEAGLDHAVNFVGSIFAWGNLQYGLEDDLGPVDHVHPYSWLWGWQYLDKQLHAYEGRSAATH